MMYFPAITAVISLLGVLTGVILFYWGKKIERQSVNKAILAEIRRLITVVGSHRDWWNDPKNTVNRDVPLIPFSTPIYDEQAKNIGLLDGSVVETVAEFYGYLQFINSLQKSRADYASIKKLNQFEEMYPKVLETFCQTYTTAFDEAFQKYGLT
jgi:hypothetical protein